MKILLADDNPEEREAMAALLATDGHRVSEVGDGHAALAWLQAESADVVVSDFEMPGMGGGELIPAIQRRWPDLPVLLVSSHPDALLEGRRLGVRVLRKPVPAETLLATVEGVVAEGAPQPTESTPRPVAGGGTVLTQGPRPRRSGLGRGAFRALSAAAALAGGLALFVLVGPRAPELPDPPTNRVVRGGSIELLDPLGPLGEPPRRLRWRASGEAAEHRVVLERVDGQVFFEETLDQRAVEPARVFELPTELVAGFAPMVVYHWRVEALDTQGRVSARSERGRFRVLAPPEPSSNSVDSTSSTNSGDSP